MTEPTDVSPEAQEQLRNAVDTAIAKPNAAQGFLSNIPDLSAVGGAKDKILSVIDTVLGAINTVQQYQWLIPEKYRYGVQQFEDALTKVRGWLD